MRLRRKCNFILLSVSTCVLSCLSVNACLTGQFTFGTASTCSDKNCPGTCVDVYTCCADECFSVSNSVIIQNCKLGVASENISEEIQCRNTLEEIHCVSNQSGSPFDICLHQLSALVEQGGATVATVNPVHCPCNDGYTKIDGACSIECGDDDGRCYNTTDAWTNEPACCLNNNILPINADCEQNEESIRSVISTNFVECTINCIDTCRETGFGRLPACCRVIPTTLKVESESSSGLSGGVIALIVILVVAVPVVVIIVIYFLRKRRSKESDP